MNQFVQRDGDTQSFVHHERGVENQIVRSHNVERIQIPTQPAGKILELHALLGNNQGNVQKIVRRNAFFLCQGMVFSDKESPDVTLGKVQKIVFEKVGRSQQNAKVQNSLVQFFRNIAGVSAV